jgi:ferredoxin--NADP+ reductase
MPTREPDVPKRYLQDLLTGGEMAEAAGGQFDPSRTHVFLCGNPAMIGLPEEVDGELRFPETTGVVELLVARGFKLDRRGDPGNIHYEEYW